MWKDNRFNFLDCYVYTDCNKFHTSVFRKKNFSGLGTIFFSFCSFSFKVNFFKTLIYGGFKISSSYKAMHLQFEFLRIFFRSNGFPLGFINSAIKFFLSNMYNHVSISPIEIRYFQYCILGNNLKNWRPNSYFYFLNILRTLICTLSLLTSTLVLVNSFKLGYFFSYKDRLPKAMCASLVYKCCCARSASECVGSTTRTLHTRVAEHAGRSFRTGSILSVPPHSMVRIHSESCGVLVTLDDFCIIGSTSSAIDLRILQSMHIFKLKAVLNDCQSSYPLSIVNF